MRSARFGTTVAWPVNKSDASSSVATLFSPGGGLLFDRQLPLRLRPAEVLSAIEAARQSGGKMQSLTLIAPAGLGPEINGDYIQGFVGAASRRDLKPVVENLFADPGKVTRQLVEDLLKYKRLDGVDAALGALAAGSFKDGRQQALLADALGKLGVPVLIVWGKEDKIIPAAHAGNAAAAAPIARSTSALLAKPTRRAALPDEGW